MRRGKLSRRLVAKIILYERGNLVATQWLDRPLYINPLHIGWRSKDGIAILVLCDRNRRNCFGIKIDSLCLQFVCPKAVLALHQVVVALGQFAVDFLLLLNWQHGNVPGEFANIILGSISGIIRQFQNIRTADSLKHIGIVAQVFMDNLAAVVVHKVNNAFGGH